MEITTGYFGEGHHQQLHMVGSRGRSQSCAGGNTSQLVEDLDVKTGCVLNAVLLGTATEDDKMQTKEERKVL